MAVLYKNNAASSLASGINTTATSIVLVSGGGAKFPAPTGSDFFYLTILDGSGNFEIVKVTVRTTDTLTVVRAQEGTTALSFSSGVLCELRITGGLLDQFKTDTASGITSSNVTNALGFTPYNASNPSGYITGITSSNVTTALGFTPYNATNPSGFISGITSGMVTTALGYTPYNSSNPSGYITGITSGMVTTALGFTPYNNSNPSGYITSSALSPYLTTASAASTYASLSGSYANPSWITSLDASKLTGTLDNARVNGGTYTINITGNAGSATLATGANQLNSDTSSKASALQYWQLYGNTTLNPNGDWHWAIRMSHGDADTYYSATLAIPFGSDSLYFRRKTNGTNQSWISVLNSANYNSYSPTLTGTGASGTWAINITGSAATATDSTKLPLAGGDMSGRIRMGTFAQSQNNTGEAWIGRAADRSTGTMTVQLGNSADRVFEIVDNPWSTVIFNAGMNSFNYKGSAILHAGNYSSYAATAGHNHTYDVNNPWLRDANDDSNVKLYGNTRQMVFRTDGTTEFASGVGPYAFAWMYGGDSASERRMLLTSAGRLWTNTHGWMDEAFAPLSHGHSYLPLSGGTITNYLTLNLGDPTIVFQDTDHRSAMIHVNSNIFYVLRGAGTNSSGWATANGYWPLTINLENNNAEFGGTLNSVGALTQGSNQVLHAGNYNSYAPTLTGTGASGTWAIKSRSINAVRTSNTDFNSLSTAVDTFTAGTNYIPSGGGYNQPVDGDHHYLAWGGIEGAAQWAAQIDINFYDDRVWFRRQSGANWQAWRQFIHDGNYNSYAPTLTGTGASGTWGISITGTASNLAADTSTRFKLITFTGEGGDSGNGSLPTSYGIYQQGGAWASPFPDLCIGFHTGIKIGAHYSYNGTRFYNNSDWATEIFSVGNGDSNVRVVNTLFIGGNTALHAGNYSSYAQPLIGYTPAYGNAAYQSGSLDAIKTPGLYHYDGAFGGTTPNGSPNYRTIEIGATDRFSQIAMPWDSANMYFRRNQGGWQAWRTVIHDGNYNSYAPTLTGGSASGTWGINITGNAGSANILGTTRNINGTGFNGSANIDTTEWFHSDRDFPSGTLITTNINYAVTYGDPFVLEIRGNSYGSIVPLDLQYQGYIYADTIINHGGLSNGLMISGLVAINNGGNLCFWFPTQGYWNGYNVKVYAAYATRAVNRVTSITGTGKPTTAKEVALTANIRQSLHSSNYTTYAPSLTGSGASGTWSINVTGTAGSAPANGGTATALNSGHYINRTGSYGTTVVNFQNVPAGTYRYQGDDANLGDSPGGTWWHYEHMRHSNGSNYWGTTIAWGWEDNANRLAVRNVTGGSFQGWVYYLNSSNYNSYSPTLTGTGASGTWGIAITGNSGNTSSISNAVGGGYTWTGIQYFMSNRNTTSDSPPLQAFSSGGGGAIMSFHRGGYYAVNFGLDSDNVMRIGGWSAAANRWQLDMSGNGTYAGNVTAYSDERLKTNWRDMPEDYVTRLAEVKVGIYDRIDEKEMAQVGVSAQSLQKLLPQAIMTAKDEMQTLSVSYGNAALASSVELAKEVVDLRTRVAQLEFLINQLIGD